MSARFTHRFTATYGRPACDIFRRQSTDLEMTAESIRQDPKLHNLTEHEAIQVADVFESAGLLFRQALTKAPQDN